MKFQTNIGGLDKGIRIGVGALLIVLALLGVSAGGAGWASSRWQPHSCASARCMRCLASIPARSNPKTSKRKRHARWRLFR